MASPRLIVFAMVVFVSASSQGRHIRGGMTHHSDAVVPELHDTEKQAAASPELVNSDDILLIDIIKSRRPVWFVPINSPYWFGDSRPCEEGKQRDRAGKCRDVW